MEVVEFEKFLMEINRTVRVYSFYPITHPALQNVISKMFPVVKNLLNKYEQIEFEVSRNGFILDGEQVLMGKEVYRSLAYEFFRRKIKKVFILKKLTETELKPLFTALATEPDSLENAGGVESLLKDYRVQNLWINSIDFSLRKEIEEKGPPIAISDFFNLPKAESPDAERLTMLLGEIEEKIDTDEFSKVLMEMRALSLNLIELHQWKNILPVLEVLAHLSESMYISDEKREFAKKVLLSLVNKELIEYLIMEYLGSPSIRAMDISLIFKQIGKISYPFFLKELVESEDKVERKKLIKLSAMMGKSIEEYLFRLLEDSRWFVLRNIIIILGEIEDPASLPYIEPLLKNKDSKIKKEIIRTYIKIDKGRSIEKLKDMYLKGNKDIKKTIIFSLKMIKDRNVLLPIKFVLEKEKSVELKLYLLENIKGMRELIDFEEFIDYLSTFILKNTKKLSGNPNELAIAGIDVLYSLGNAGRKRLQKISSDNRGKIVKIIEKKVSNETAV